ncbi:MAG: AMP-binding protein [Bacteroidales bacterium]|nr:AMP-binding protein [Bacteroidales bacterium]
MENSLFKQIESNIRRNWGKPSLSDYNGATFAYRDVSRKIIKLHILFENCGIKKGDRIAICSRNMATWGVTFIATITYGAVAVPILHEFKPDNIHHIVNHSESRLLFVGDDVWKGLEADEMPDLDGVFRMEDYSIRLSRKESLTEARMSLNKIFGERYPERFTADDVKFEVEDPEELALINYTSGTSGSSKGVMIPYRAIYSNLKFAIEVLSEDSGQTMLAMLPMAHMYGLAFEFIYGFCIGSHITFLGRIPSPKIVTDAFASVRPDVIITVPLVIEKIIRKSVMPKLQTPMMKFLLSIPFVKNRIYKVVHDQLRKSLGGNFKELIIGGAPLSREVEQMLCDIRMEYTVGYGMTEFAPILAYSGWATYKPFSCGRPAPRMELKIDSEDPQNIVGEILARGENTMMGYFKNEEAMASFVDEEGWCHTGDLGLMDSEGNVFIKGRSKSMILGPSGQNIYPEEIEDRINSLSYVNESVVVDREGRITALIYPDFDRLKKAGVKGDKVLATLNESMKSINAILPAYCQVANIEICNEEFEKTPKKSIKRYLYK